MPLLRNVFVLNSSYVRLSPESAQVKLSAIEIKFQFTIFWENNGQNFIINDLSNLFRAKESMALDYSGNNWSRKFEFQPLIKVALRSILHWTKFPVNISKLFLTKEKGTNVFRSH